MFHFLPKNFPDSPGVYLMKDPAGRILYVGKAISLRKRLASYFRENAPHTPKTRALLARVASIDVLHTATEKEALLLEESLIKKHRPRYNVILRDDKSYVLFKLDRTHPFPRLVMTRKVERDGSVYYGPFTSALAARRTLKLLGRLFPLRKCSDRAFANRVRPCLYHHMKQCLAPCTLPVDPETYRDMVRRIELFLSGRSGELLAQLDKDMRRASAELRFEDAAELRDTLKAVRQTLEGQAAVLSREADLDAAALAEVSGGLGLGLVFVRQGRLLDQKSFHFPDLALDDGPEALAAFLLQFYQPSRFIPPRILVPFLPDDPLASDPLAAAPLAADVLAERRAAPVRIAPASSTEEKQLLDIARRAALAAAPALDPDPAEALAKRLRLPAPPLRIEAIDASHLAGQNLRVGQVVFLHGKPSPDDYRLFAFPHLEGSADDYAALAAWAARRVEAGPPWPGLLLIDGGQGQLAAVARALADAGLPPDSGLELAAIAKGPTRAAGQLHDLVFRPGRKNPASLPPGSPELLFLQRLRDAVHRFTLARQRASRKASTLQSDVASLPGVGPKTARILWDRFQTLDAILHASLDDLTATPGIGPKRGARLHEALARLAAARR